MTYSVVLCEGYHDRAFWSGWLTHLGCIDPGQPPSGTSARVRVIDPFGSVVAGGSYAYHTPVKNFLLVVPCHGRAKMLPAARTRLLQRGTEPLLRLVINIDPDTTAASTSITGLKQADVERFVQQQFDPAAKVNADGDIEVDGGATKVSLIRWEVGDPDQAGLPSQQTLERLVCAALIAAYPNRAKVVQDWLDGRPQPPTGSPKDHAWSHMAGWYAEYGCDAFYSLLWRDPRLVPELEFRLRASSAWRIAEALAI